MPAITFQTTRWSLVVAAGGATNARSKRALSELCGLYWDPVHAFVRHGERSPEAARDLTQGFFEDLLQRNDLGTVDPTRGKFRSWLLGCVKHYLAKERAHHQAQKRGGGVEAVPLHLAAAEERSTREPTDGVTPEQLYLRRWAMLLLGRVLDELREEKVRTGKVERFDLLQPFLVDQGESSYATVGLALGLKDNAVKVAVHGLRERFRERLRAEIAGTVVSAEEIDEEIRQLLAALG